MDLRKTVSGAAAGALALAMAATGLAQSSGTAPKSPVAPAQSAAPPSQTPQAQIDPTVARRIKPDEVKKRVDAGEKVVFVDTRSSTGDAIVKGAVHVPSSRIDAWAKDIAKDTFIVTYCT
jgi:hypothetical protein